MVPSIYNFEKITVSFKKISLTWLFNLIVSFCLGLSSLNSWGYNGETQQHSPRPLWFIVSQQVHMHKRARVDGWMDAK